MPRTYALARWSCLRLLGICLVAHFASTLQQVRGLIGSTGITPVADLLAARTAGFDPDRLVPVPTLFWLSTSDTFLVALTWLGLAAGIAVTIAVGTRTACALAYVILLSFRTLEPIPFAWFNWPFDDLLTEVSFLAVFLAPAASWRSPLRLRDGPAWTRWLAMWLLFRLMFGTGFTKLMVGGSWLDLTAVHAFLVTQMFPSELAAWLQELPHFVSHCLAAFTLCVELAAPWGMLWAGRPARISASLMALLMLGLMLAGNFRGFNVLTIGLLLLCFDDAWLRRWLPRALATRLVVEPARRGSRWPGLLVGGVVVACSIGPVAEQVTGRSSNELPCRTARSTLHSLHLAANYFMFCVVPPERLGLVVQGSPDGEQWHDYQPRHLVAAVDRWPRWFHPLTDQLGFSLWLAAYGPPEVSASWLPRLLERLRAGEPTVRRLFAVDPFGDSPPIQVRAALFRFRFAPPEQRARGSYWQREFLAVHAITR